jgi:LPXTG-site transpeptidase (sortase) family protein
VTPLQHGRGQRLTAAALVLLGVAMIIVGGVMVTRSSAARTGVDGTTERVAGAPTVPLAPPAVSSSAPQPAQRRGNFTIHRPGDRPVNWQMPNPIRLLVPAMGMSAPIIPLGLNPDGSLEVPKSFSVAGWFTKGPEPGERGASVIAGHFDSTSGPGVFYRLRALRRGDIITVVVGGGSEVRCAVTSTLAVKKTRFPTSLVYRKTAQPTLRLITCDGAFDSSTGHYVDNYIVFATMINGAGARSGPVRSSGTVEVLPDLRQEAPAGLHVTKAGGRFRLGFESAATNVGPGPLVIRGQRPAGAATMAASQRIQLGSGATRVISNVGRLRYVVSPDHEHWHLEPFMRYEIRRSTGGPVIGRDAKTGFCLGDRYAGPALPRSPRKKVFTSNCGRGQKGLLSITEGISVGYGDAYAADLDGQFIDITGLHAGRYYLIHRVNSSHRLIEASYGNNVAWASFELSWKNERARVRILDRCSPTTQPNSCGAVGR